MDDSSPPVQRALVDTLDGGFSPTHLEVSNESGMHNVAPGSETHFKVIIVSESFVGQSLVQRHRAVHKALDSLLAGPIHALSLHLYSPEQWADKLDKSGAVPDSPPCLGGSTNDKS